MKISVIIPAYKARKFLADCLKSVGAQTLSPDEVLVIDDCSPEPIDDIIADFTKLSEYPPLRLLKHEVNRGQAAGRNTGIKAACGDWLAFLDCDDMWAPNHLESVMSTAESTDADLVFCPGVLFTDDPQDPDNYVLRPLSEGEKAHEPLALVNRCFIITSSTLVRGSCLRNIGGFDESQCMRGVEDADCFLRLLKQGSQIQMAQQPTLYYRKHPESATGRTGYLARQSIRVRQKHLAWVDAPASTKHRVLIENYWYCTSQLWKSKANDRLRWVAEGLLRSTLTPLHGARHFARFLKNVNSKPSS